MTLLLVLQGILILLFLLAGFFKLAQTKEKIVAGGGAWAADFQTGHIKMIGMLECALSLGLLLPFLISVPQLVPTVASTGMGLVMMSAVFVHIKRKEYGFVVFTLLLSLIAFYVTWTGCSSVCMN
jgi:hypothetical protein